MEVLKRMLREDIDAWFYNEQNRRNIGSGDEPLDSSIGELLDALVKECNRVLEWQTEMCEKGKPLFIFNKELSICNPDESLTGCKLSLLESLSLYCDGEDYFDKNSKEYFDRMELIVNYYKENKL